MKDSEILRKARKLIENKKFDWICSAIDDVKAPEPAKTALCQWIHKMLNGAIFYSTWLKENYPNVHFKANGSFREGRLQWLDWMIAYCEKEEANAQSTGTSGQVEDKGSVAECTV